MLSKLHIAIAIPAFAFGLSMPAWADEASVQDPAATSSQPPKHPPTNRMDEAVSPQTSHDFKPEISNRSSENTQIGSDSGGKRHPHPKTHPPTTAMDKAMSPQKSGDPPKSEDQPTTTGPSGEAVRNEASPTQ